MIERSSSRLCKRQSGLQLNYNEKSGLLEIVGKLDGGSDTHRAGFTALINDETTFNILDGSMYSANGVTQNVNFGLYDPNNHHIVMDFSAFSKHPTSIWVKASTTKASRTVERDSLISQRLNDPGQR